MTVYIVTSNRGLADLFTAVSENKTDRVKTVAFSSVARLYNGLNARDMVYLDVDDLEDADINGFIDKIGGLDSVPYGIIDTTGKMSDVALLFYRGAVDYIGPGLLKTGLSAERVNLAREYVHGSGCPDPGEMLKKNYIPSGPGWDNVITGNEYTFCFMYIELDGKSDIQQKFRSPQAMQQLVSSFKDFVGRWVAPDNGQVWTWSDLNGLVLFPFCGKECSAVVNSVRMFLYRRVNSIEQMDYDMLLSFRIVLHIGNTVYKETGNTGKIISDSINYIYHLGQKYARSGNLYITGEVAPFIPPGLKDYFVADGKYEEYDVLRLKEMAR